MKSTPPPAWPSEDLTPPPCSRPTVSIIHSDALQAGLLSTILRKAGMEVRLFPNAAASLHQIAQSPPPNLIILDLHMPEINGWRLCRLLRSPVFAKANACPILVTSTIYTGREVEDISRDLGACGFLTLPCSEEYLLQAAQAAMRGDKPGSRSRVLIVDDEKSMRQYIAHALELNGFEIREAATAGQAMAEFDAGKPAVVLLDHHLPEVEGIDLIPHFKKPGSPVVVIAMTGDLDPELAVEYARRGIDGFAYKPLTIKQLISIITHAQRERALLRVEELLTERTRVLRQNDARMMQTVRLASLGDMAAGIAHEINNPLFGVTSSAELLGQNLPPGSNDHQLADMILKEGNRIAVLVKRLLAFSGNNQSAMASHPVHDLVANTLTLVGTRLHNDNIRLRTSIPGNLPGAVCHSSQIQQMLITLLMTAADAVNTRTPLHGGDKILTLRASAVNNQDVPGLQLEISNHALGSAPQPLLFRALCTAQESGVDWGLLMAKDIAERHGGRIEVASGMDAFTHYRIILPAAAPSERLPVEA